MPAPKDPAKREEWLRKISRKGDTPWNKGKSTPDNVRKKQSDARFQFYQTEVGKEFLKQQAIQAGNYHRNKPKSELHKQRIAASHLGIPKGVGHQVSDAVRTKIATRLKEWYRTEDGLTRRAKASLQAQEQMAQNGNYGAFGYGKSGNHESSKAGLVHYRSSYELEVFKQLDNIDDVLTYQVEPFAIPYTYEGVQRNYIPDILIIFTDNEQLLVEVKPNHKLDDPQNIAKFSAAQQQFGDHFEIWSEELIFQQ